MDKKNVFIKLFEPSERRKYVFCGLKSAQVVANMRACICSSSKIYAEPVFVLEYHFLKKDRGTKNEYSISFLTLRKFIYINGRNTKQH